jgi:hypothetical protein
MPVLCRCAKSARESVCLKPLNQAIPDPRDARFIIHDQKGMLAQRIIAIALGYEDLSDHQALRSDPAGRNWVRSQPKHGRPDRDCVATAVER